MGLELKIKSCSQLSPPPTSRPRTNGSYYYVSFVSHINLILMATILSILLQNRVRKVLKLLISLFLANLLGMFSYVMGYLQVA